MSLVFLLSVFTASFLTYCTVKVILDFVKSKKSSHNRINPRDVRSFIEPIKRVYYKILPDGSIVEGVKNIGDKTVYFFKKSKKQMKEELKMKEHLDKINNNPSRDSYVDREFYGVMDRDFSNYQREDYMEGKYR